MREGGGENVKDRTKAIVCKNFDNLSTEDFNQWLLEYLTKDINDRDRDELRLETLRYVAEEGLI